MKRSRDTIFRFNERNIKRSHYSIGLGVPTAISFGMGFVTDKFTRKRARTNFRGIFVKYVHQTTDLMKVCKVGFPTKPEFKRGAMGRR